METDIQLTKFFARLARSSSRVLMLDYDGTLAPFRKDRDHALPYPGVTDILNRIQADGQTRLVLISGRSVKDLKALLALDRHPEMWGSHGWEHLRSDGVYTTPDIEPEVRTIISAVAGWASRTGYAEQCEEKPAGIALHWRGIAQTQAEALRSRFSAWWGSQTCSVAIGLHEFDGGLELRANGRDKGDATREVLSNSPAGTVAAFLGDDATDEDAFKVIDEYGLAVLVRTEHRVTGASAWIKPPEGLLNFLSDWRENSRMPPEDGSGSQRYGSADS